jgi:hypothetical protein
VPEIAPIEASILSDDTDISVCDGFGNYVPYHIANIEQGLEGVVFVHYRRIGEYGILISGSLNNTFLGNTCMKKAAQYSEVKEIEAK